MDEETRQLAHRPKRTIRKTSYPDCPSRQSADRASLPRRLWVQDAPSPAIPTQKKIFDADDAWEAQRAAEEAGKDSPLAD